MHEITVASPAGQYLDAGYVVLGVGFVLLSVGTALLHERARARATLVMLIAVLLGWVAVALMALGPEDEQRVVSDVLSDASGAFLGDQHYFRSVRVLMWPAFVTMAASVLAWSLAFVAYAWSLDASRGVGRVSRL